jgi:tripartite-type tricarboxylate transporter receptor subunit TctC
MLVTRRGLVAATAGLATPGLAAAQPEDWPRRPVRIIVPYAPGGGTDLSTRLLAEGMRPVLGQPVIVENRAGANGVIGSDVVARAPADGYLFVSVTSGHITNRYVMPNMPFDPVRDFTPVAMLVSYPMVLVGSGIAPFGTLRDLVAYARSNPRKVSFGTSTTLNSYVGTLFARTIGSEMTEVPYRGGGPMMADLIAGHLDLGWSSPESALSQRAGGRLNILAVTTKKRLPMLGDVPTVAEAGFPDFDFTGWVGLYGPAKLPAAITDRVHAALVRAIADPVIHDRIVEMGNYGVIEGPEPFAERTRRDNARWERAVQDGLLTRPG